jgi:hypothetical protein
MILNSRLSSSVRLGIASALFLLVLVTLSIANYRYSAQAPGGTDFVPRWLAVRLLLTEGQNPYSDSTSLAIQQVVYGREAPPGQDQVLFVYPLYSVFLFGPFSLIGNYILARALWMTLLEVALVLLLLFSLRLARWRLSLIAIAALLLFSLTWYHSARPLINGNASIMTALFVAAGFMLIHSEHDLAAGAFLGMASIKPQALVLLVPFILLWAYSRGRMKLIASTIGTFLILLALSVLIIPDWMPQNIEQILAYPQYTLPGTPGSIAAEWFPSAGIWIGAIIGIVLVVIMFWRWRRAWGQDFNVFLPTAMLTLVITNLIGITTATSNYIILLPGLILVLAEWERKYGRLGRTAAILIILAMFFGLWALFWLTVSGRRQSSLLFFPLPIFLLIALLAIPTTTRRTEG